MGDRRWAGYRDRFSQNGEPLRLDQNFGQRPFRAEKLVTRLNNFFPILSGGKGFFENRWSFGP